MANLETNHPVYSIYEAEEVTTVHNDTSNRIIQTQSEMFNTLHKTLIKNSFIHEFLPR